MQSGRFHLTSFSFFRSYSGLSDEVDADGNVEILELNQKPVFSVVGSTPLEAWGKVLIKLGLVDEIMAETAYEAVQAARMEGLAEAKGKLQGKKRAKKDTGSSTTENSNSVNTNGAHEEMQSSSDSLPEKEIELRERVASLRAQLKEAKADDQSMAIDLANTRIDLIGPFLCNPFYDSEGSISHQASWLATAVRKEKTKMGSTGNKKKIVTATDLLERNNTFYNESIETLLEGLPGSEYCTAYIYEATRASGAAAVNRAWVHEAQLRQEREKEKRIKQTKEAKAKASQQREKELKRKQRDEQRDARKRQKLEEEEEKKKQRAEERLSRLTVQVEERLYKEASFQREKVVSVFAKNLAKEFGRRRKAAELVARQAVFESKRRHSHVDVMEELPPLSIVYEEDVVRIWDFVNTFGSFFLQRGFIDKLPTLDSLQAAINALRGTETANMTKAQAISSMTALAVSLCKPLASGLTRMLFASLIALNPALQKDFGAAFFNEVNTVKSKDKEDSATSSSQLEDVLLPVDAMTWQEIARIAFLSDSLGELGYSRQEAAHLLRGYRVSESFGGNPIWSVTCRAY